MQSVRLTGSVPHEEVAGLIRQFDVALAPYPSLQHPFYFSPLKLFEYMACGVPVVAADVGQIGEVVRDGETGLLYPADDLDALTAACDRLLAAPSLRRRLGEAAAQEIHARYTWDQNAVRVTELARGLIAAPQNRRSGGIHRDGQDAQAGCPGTRAAGETAGPVPGGRTGLKSRNPVHPGNPVHPVNAGAGPERLNT